MLVLKLPSIKHSANLDMTERPDLQIIEIEEGEETYVRETESIFKQNYKKIPQPKEDTCQCTRNTQNTK